MIRRGPCQIMLLFIFGILTVKGVYMGKAMLVIGAFLSAMLCIGLCMRFEPPGKKHFRRAFLLALAFGAGMLKMHTLSAATICQTAGIEDGQDVSVQGRIIKKQCKETKNAKQNLTQNLSSIQWVVHIKDSYLKLPGEIRPCGSMIVYLGDDEPVIGNTIVVSGKTKLFSMARNEGNFHERAYYQNQGYTLKIYADSKTYRIMDVSKDPIRESLYHIQQSLQEVYQRAMPEEEAGALAAMLLGEKSLLSDEVKDLYRQSGIAHVLAISGLHISILGMAIYQLMRKLGASYAISAIGSAGLMLLFGLMTGFGISTMRAILMFGIYLGAECCGRAYDSLNALAIAALYILFTDARVLFLAGFQFSFAAVLGVLLGKEVCSLCQPKFKMTETVLVSLGIQMLTLPLTAWYYYEIPLYSLLLNMLVLPFMEAVLISGLVGGALGVCASMGTMLLPGLGLPFLPYICTWLHFVSGCFLRVCTFLLKYFTKAGSLFLKFPGSVHIIGQPQEWQMFGYYSVLCAFVCFMLAREREHRKKNAALGKVEKSRIGFFKRERSVIMLGSLASLLLLFVPWPKKAEVSVLDVGQGDGIYIHTSDGADVWIDGGSNDVSQVGTYRILPFLKAKGIAKIDYWFVSHLDQDHTSGIYELLDCGYAIGQAVFAKGVLKDEAFAKLESKLSDNHVKIQYLEKGGQLRSQNASFRCLLPEENESVADRNARSLVLLYEDSGFVGFFPGDISANEERELFTNKNLPRATLYKAAHHGSKYSNSQEMLSLLSPVVSIVSCAKENDYGHPGEEAIKHMEDNSERVYYTMQSGEVCVSWDKRGIKVKEYVQKYG